MREVVLTAASLALTGAVVANAYYQKHQFYPSVVYLTKSSPSMAVSRRPSLLKRVKKPAFSCWFITDQCRRELYDNLSIIVVILECLLEVWH